MLKNIPAILSPELLAVLCEMGHSDRIVLGDANFPGISIAKAGNAKFIRADGHGIPELMEAILTLFPLDEYTPTPAMLMEKMERDKHLDISVWKDYETIISKHDKRGTSAIGSYERFEFYERAKEAYCVIQTGETEIYANIILQKGVI